MTFYNAHSHAEEIKHEDFTIVSVDIRKPFELSKPSHQFYSVGIHPWHIKTNDREAIHSLFTKVYRFSQLPKIVAIGETGLDKTSAKSTIDFDFQQEIFNSHARIAEKVKKPLIIHCVKAYDEILHVRQSIKPSVPWIIHGFRGKTPLASRLLKADIYLSFGKHYHIESLKAAWQKGRLLLETDDSNISIREIYQKATHDLAVSEQALSDEIEIIFKFFAGKIA